MMEKVFYDIFDEMPRLGPGSDESTVRALSKVALSSPDVVVLDLGCGTGAQTMVLAKHIKCTIIALDNYQPFLDQIKQKVERESLKAKVECVNEDMNAFHFENNSIDLAWGEGSIYIIGFRAGLEKIKPMLKPDGYVVFSDMNWRKQNPPSPVLELFRAECPQMITVEENIRLIESQGFQLLDYFLLDKAAHWEQYYKPLESRLQMFRGQFSGDPKVKTVVDMLQHEVDIYKQYSDYFGYTFYIMKKSL